MSSPDEPAVGSLSIRLADASDATRVRDCVTAAFTLYIERIGRPPGPMLLDFAALVEERKVWLAEPAVQKGSTDAIPDGVLVMYDTAEGFYIDTIAVHPSRQGTGLGRRLLDFAAAEARRRGIAFMHLCTNAKMTENQRFYPAMGWLETGRGTESGYDRVFYRKAVG